MRIRYLLVLLMILFFKNDIWAFNDDLTHRELIRRAIPASNIETYLFEEFSFSKDVGEVIDGKPIAEWLEYGAEMEDAEDICRASNHFHNPNLPWGGSGLTDTWWLANLYCLTFSDYRHDALISDLTWATGFFSKNSTDIDEKIIAENKYDWTSAREYLYTYLTGKDAKGNLVEDDATRRKSLAKSMRALGQVLHLLQDMAVPAHVRNDFSQGHLMFIPEYEDFPWFGNRFEGYVRGNNNADWFNSSIKCDILTPSLTDFWDTDDSTGIDTAKASGLLGLSEYTQINFFSRYSIFSSDFPYPQEEYCEYFTEPPYDFFSHERKYLSTSTSHPGEQVKYLATVGYLVHCNEEFLDYAGPQQDPELSYFTLDNKCYNEYASKLVPRAIGYSADLIDYFFRGKLHVSSLPVINNNSITAFELTIKNMTPTQEEISNGTFSVSISYTNPDDGNDKFVLSDEVLSGVLEYDQEGIKFQFFLTEPVPIASFDFGTVKCMLAFKGKLGNEENAVIGKSFKPGEIKFLEAWNNDIPESEESAISIKSYLAEEIEFSQDWGTIIIPWYHSTPEQNLNNGTTTNDIIDGVFYKENLRYIGSDYARINQSFIYFKDFDTPYQIVDENSPDGILITPDTYLQFKIDDLSINETPPAPEGYTTAYQYLVLAFNAIMNENNIPEIDYLSLQFTQPGQGLDRPFIIDVAYSFQFGTVVSVNIYDAFQSQNLTIPEPFYLQEIGLTQRLFYLELPSTIEHVQNMEVDFISIVESYVEPE